MKALITGITGQDGSYLAELLLSKGYEVYGISRRVAVDDYLRYIRLKNIMGKIKIFTCDICSYQQVFNIINQIKPDEIYHLAAQSFVKASFDDEFTTFKINLEGTENILSAIKNASPKSKFYFAGTSEMFGEVRQTPQNEDTPFNPVSPYGISKTAGYFLTKMYRESYNIYAVTGILFNHESERRGSEFVTKKIVNYFKNISRIGRYSNKLELGNIDAKRDWGYSPEYVEAMYLMLHNHVPKDYVVGTGVIHTVKDIIDHIAKKYYAPAWEYVKVTETNLRPKDVNILCADASRIKKDLGWEYKTDFYTIIDRMYNYNE